jgi:uncharacterized Tic20 family protein
MPDDPVLPPPIFGPDENQSRMWNMLCHLSALSGLIVPFGNILGPLLIWQIKKHEIPSVEAHGKAALNFQITVALAVVVGGAAAMLLSFFCVGFLLLPVIIGIGLCGLIFAVIAGLKANEGQDYRYPYSFEFIK